MQDEDTITKILNELEQAVASNERRDLENTERSRNTGRYHSRKNNNKYKDSPTQKLDEQDEELFDFEMMMK